MTRLHRIFLLAVVLVPFIFRASPAGAQETPARPFVHSLFTDNMVMPRDVAAPVWGWSEPGSQITVTMAGKSARGTADASGRWSVKLGPMPAGGPFVMTIDGPRKVVLSNVLVGDVWLCSGQSNMGFPVKNAAGADQILSAADVPQVRLFSVKTRPATEPVNAFAETNAWQPANPETARDFSAVAFCFGRELHQHLKVPIGLIHTSAGATTIEAWSSVEALKSVPGGDRDVAGLAEWKELLVEWAKYDADPAYYKKLMVDWYLKNDPGSASPSGNADECLWADAKLEDTDWKSMNLPGNWQQGGLPGFEGVVWFRREFDLAPSAIGKDLVLFLGPIDRRDTVWVNGVKVGQSDSNGWVRQYKVDAKLLKVAGNKVAVRVLGAGGFAGNPDQLALKETPGGPVAMSLAGPWRFREGVKLRNATRVPSLRSGNPSIPGALFNGAISPLTPFAIKGAVWYQGESSTSNAGKYAISLPALIKDWRLRFGVGDFPFLIVQLPGFGETHETPGTSAWALFREVQAGVAGTVPNCGLVTTIDLGEPKNVHPRNKFEVGRRLALLAEGTVYGESIEYAGPTLKQVSVEAGRIRVRFDHADGLIAADAKNLAGFAIAGEDRHFVRADAVIDGDQVVVSSPLVPRPMAVRYAWDDTPLANLTNRTGLPATPFRSDRW